MTSGSPPATEQPPEIPFDVELFIEMELNRHQANLDQDTPESEELRHAIHTEYEAWEAEGANEDEIDPDVIFLSCAVAFILKDMRAHFMRLDDEDPLTLTDDERTRRGEQSGMYAYLLNSGLDVMDWRSSLPDVEWPSEAHAVCGAVVLKMANSLEGTSQIVDLIDELGEDAVELAPFDND